MNTTTDTTAKFDHILTLEDAARRARATAVYTSSPSIEKDAIATQASNALTAAIAELTVDEIVAYGEHRKGAK